MSLERGKFITVHGIDGTGKTQTAEAVRREAERRGLRTINFDTHEVRKHNPHSAEKERLDQDGTIEERLMAHLRSTLYHSDQINSFLDQGYHVVKSRYLDDVMAHFAHLGVPQERLDAVAKQFPIVQPDLKVILVVDEPLRIERVGARQEGKTAQDLDPKTPGTRAHYFEQYIQQTLAKSPHFKAYDTGRASSEAIAKSIIDTIIEGA